MVPRLPLEVVERIIENVATGYYDSYSDLYDFSSTKACALVCHSFLPLCRKHLFASVTLNSRSYPVPHTSDDLNQLLSDSPHLAVYIRELDYHVHQKEFVGKRSPWLLAMFKKLVKLQKLSITYLPGKKLDWMSSSGRKVLLPLLHLPTLNSISLSAIRNFPLADLTSCVNLKNLHIGSLECSKPNGVGKFLEALPPTPAMLEELTIDARNASVKPLQQLCRAQRPDGKPIIDISSLMKFTATVARLDSMTEFFGMWRNLRKIDLIIEREASPDPWESTSSLKGLFAMLKPSLPTLMDINIEYYIDNDDSDGTDAGPLAGLCHELEKMVGQNMVETIKLLIWVGPGDYDFTRWSELDSVLSMGSPEGWPALREVSLSFNVIRTSRNDSINVKALQNLPMTKLVESKRVEFDFQVTEFPMDMLV